MTEQKLTASEWQKLHDTETQLLKYMRSRPLLCTERWYEALSDFKLVIGVAGVIKIGEIIWYVIQYGI